MKTFTIQKILSAFSVLVFATLACKPGGGDVTTPTPSNSSANPTETPTNGGVDRGHLILATVLVNMELKQGSDFVPFGSGSGTIISADGLILTNAHVASPASQGNPSDEPDRLTIAITQSEDQPPVLSYVAEVLAVDGALDLAVIQIVSTLNGGSVNPSELNLPFVSLGNSDNLHIGDHLNIFGFPSVGADTITYTEGSVAGFIAENPPGERAWIKTATNIAHGNSGGLVADDQNEIVGVPTWVNGDCNQADSNGDGEVDTCIPNGNAINFLRPINWAKPLIEAAKNNKEYASPYNVPGVATEAGSGDESFSQFSWLDTSISQDECKNTGDSVNSYPDTAICIWTHFKYSGMTDGEQIHELWYNNAKIVGDFTYNWEVGTAGSIGTFLHNNGDSMPAGEYYVEVRAGDDDHLIGTSVKVAVGDGVNTDTPEPSGDTVTLYGVVFDADTNKPISGAYVFVLNPGVTYSQWQENDYAETYIAAYQQIGSDGKFEITGIPRGTQFTIVFSAKGYLDAFGDNLVAGPNDPDRLDFSYGMSK